MITSIQVQDIGIIQVGDNRWNIGVVEKIVQINEFTFAVYVSGKVAAHYNSSYVIEVVFGDEA
jgi:hypothetical protein